MRRLLSSFLILLAMAFAANVSAYDAAPDSQDVLELELDDNIKTPTVPGKAKKYVQASIDQLRRHFEKSGLPAKAIRDGEVLQITVGCSSLFAPCATDLRQSAGEILKQFAVVVREPAKYKVVVAVHSDDTGDTMYADSITAARANEIDDYFWQLNGEKDTNVVPYGIGKDEPLKPNSSRANRENNRRVEFFIVPDQSLIRMANRK